MPKSKVQGGTSTGEMALARRGGVKQVYSGNADGDVDEQKSNSSLERQAAADPRLLIKKRPLKEAKTIPTASARVVAQRPKPKSRPSLPNILDTTSFDNLSDSVRPRTRSIETYSTVDDGLFNMSRAKKDDPELTYSPADATQQPTTAQFNNYSYASVEFRPLIVTEDGAVSAPVDAAVDDSSDKLKIRSSSNTSARSNHSDTDQRTAHVRLPYAVVDLPGKDRGDSTETVQYASSENLSMQQELRGAHPLPSVDDEDVYDTVASLVTTPFDVEALYATVDISHKNKDRRRSPSPEAAAAATPRNDDATINGQDPTSNVVGRSKFFVEIPDRRNPSAPPAPPKPYTGPENKRVEKGHVSNEIRRRLDSVGRNSISTEDLMGSYATVEPKMEASGRRNFSCEQLDTKSKMTTLFNREDKKSFEKKHRRMRSHEKVVKLFNVPSLVPPTSVTSTSASSTENERLTPSDARSSGSSSTASSVSPDPPLINQRADLGNYQEIDVKDILKRAEEIQNDELPEGWQEVNDSGETYYWHLWSGTIQYERPVAVTPSPSSRPVSPFTTEAPPLGSALENGTDASANTAVPEVVPEKAKQQVISFPVHSMGWLPVEESDVETKVLSDTINRCLTTLAEKRHDLWNTSETWGDGRDIKLNLDGESLKLYDPKSKKILLVQPITKMRVWGIGKEEQRDFAYIARNSTSEKHKCHMFRCHGNVSGRSITNALQAICSRVLEEKRKAKERASSPAQPLGSSLLQAPVSSSVKVSAAFNEKPHLEEKKRFTAKYLGWTEVNKPSGIDVLNKAVTKLMNARLKEEWKTVLIEITTSEIRTTDCSTQALLMEDRVRFLSFFGVSRDERMCGYIVSASADTFLCHVFCCSPNAGTVTMALEEACKLRFEKVLDRHAVDAERLEPTSAIQRQGQTRSSVKGKGMALKSSMQEFFSKLQKRDSKKKGEPEKESPHPDLQKNEFMLKYFGCVPVPIGTGVDTVERSVEQLTNGSMLIGILEVTSVGLTFFDSQRTALSRRVFDLDTITFCEVTSDKRHFGIILSQGRGKYVCHVFQEYRVSITPTVEAILAVL